MQSTIQDLFTIDQNAETAAQRMSEIVESRKEKSPLSEGVSIQGDEKTAIGALESALAACEDDQDVQVCIEHLELIEIF